MGELAGEQGTLLSEPLALQGWELCMRTDTGGRGRELAGCLLGELRPDPTVPGPCSAEGARQLAWHWLWGYGVEGKVEPQEWGLGGERAVLSEAGSTLSSWLR